MGALIIMALAINNLVAFIFLGIAFLSGPPAFRYSIAEIVFRYLTYGLVISLFFSLISLGINYRFKTYFGGLLVDRLKFFLVQFIFLFLIFILTSVAVFFVLPALR